ncbi:hypothetical protein DCAR_0521042 [Daucus carota subsp. sativus]|uniref:Uncharacterized protein n=1 Tax=Daucus carota subsp. sativus TaxID=79200 RepID=A0AAF1B2L9_DAUCS|nr:hypothetical protein DCAR_0521042 [Daucus carota subsp. sativus]
MSFTLKAAQQFGIPELLLWTTSACGLLAYMHYSQLVERGYAPLQDDASCIDWLDKKESSSVVYVNFGSITVMTAPQLIEFAWGLANSMKQFVWIVRPDTLAGDRATVPQEFLAETRE